MKDLIERLEKAVGPDRELDNNILDVILPREPFVDDPASLWPNRFLYNQKMKWREQNCPMFTASFEVAMMLASNPVDRTVKMMAVAVLCRKDNLDPSQHAARLFCIRALHSRSVEEPKE